MNERYYNTCFRKRVYYRLSDAERVSDMIGDGVRPYKCPYCQAYHNGHSVDSKTRLAAKRSEFRQKGSEQTELGTWNKRLRNKRLPEVQKWEDDGGFVPKGCY